LAGTVTQTNGMTTTLLHYPTTPTNNKNWRQRI